MPTIVIGLKPEEVTDADREQIGTLLPDATVLITRERAEMEAVLDDIEIAVAGVPRDLLSTAPNLRWFQQWGAGADWLLRHPEAIERPFVLTSASGVHAIPISEHIFATLLAFARDLPTAYAAQHRGEWHDPGNRAVFELAGRTLLLIGVGAIGERTARLAHAFDMHVIGLRQHPDQTVPYVDQMVGSDELHAVLPQADVVVLTVPLTEATRGMIGAAELRLMQHHAILINIGRGGTIDETALAQSLHAGQIGGAALDVFETEPLPADSPLWNAPNLIITAHYSGSTPHYHERAMAIFLENLRRYDAGEPLLNVVDKRAGY